jgi:hypothetical protein
MGISTHDIAIIFTIIAKPPWIGNSFYDFLINFEKRLSKKLCILFFNLVLYYGWMCRVGSPDRNMNSYIFAGVFPKNGDSGPVFQGAVACFVMPISFSIGR